MQILISVDLRWGGGSQFLVSYLSKNISFRSLFSQSIFCCVIIVTLVQDGSLFFFFTLKCYSFLLTGKDT